MLFRSLDISRPEFALLPREPEEACKGPLFDRLSWVNLGVLCVREETRFRPAIFKLQQHIADRWSRLEYALYVVYGVLWKEYGRFFPNFYSQTDVTWPSTFNYRAEHKTHRAAKASAWNARSAFLLLIARIHFFIFMTERARNDYHTESEQLILIIV